MRQRSNLVKPWYKYRGKQGGGGNGERDPHSRIQGNEDKKSGKSVCWDRDRRRPGGCMTSCGRYKLLEIDRRSLGGRMALCGS